MDQGKKILVTGFVLVSLLAAGLILIALYKWSNVGYVEDDLPYIGYVILACGALYTSTHLWSRVPSFEKGTSIRTLFTMMGVTFIPISAVFFFFMIDGVLLKWAGMVTFTDFLNDLVGGNIEFVIFGIEGSMMASDVESQGDK